MKTLIVLLTLISIQALAQIIDYESIEFKACHGLHSNLYPADATTRCERSLRDGKGPLFVDKNFTKCHHLNTVNLYSSDAVARCLGYANADELQVFSGRNFDSCYKILAVNLYSSDAVSRCLGYSRNNLIDVFLSNNFLACYNSRVASIYSSDAAAACLAQFKGEVAAKPLEPVLTHAQVNENIQLPEDSQIILTQAIEVLGNQACVTPINGERDVKCWVCREKQNRNDVRYRLDSKDEATGVEQKILTLTDVKLSQDGKEIYFYLLKDGSDPDNLSSVTCNSKKPFQIKDRKELVPILDKSGFKLIIPAPKEK